MRDLRQRLRAAGADLRESEEFDDELAVAVKLFQQSRGLTESGVCDAITWRNLVEAGFNIGDRVLYLRSPYFRGDDVTWLQMRLGNLGFDPGRVDGIYGARTRDAVREFQINVCLPPDGIAGRSTVEELMRVFGRSREHIHGVRELELMRHSGKAIADASIACFGSLYVEVEAEMLSARLKALGAKAIAHAADEQSWLANLANQGGFDLVVYFDYSSNGVHVAYYSGFRYTSPAGKRLAEEVSKGIERLSLPYAVGTRGMTLPILRETRMPVVVVGVANARGWQIFGPEIVDAVSQSVASFIACPAG